MSSPIVIFERGDQIAIIRLNRPDKRNALSRAMMIALGDAFKNLEGEPNVRAVILTGADDQAFCAGTRPGTF
jgi:crotonobetainyl-CoA hydratase